MSTSPEPGPSELMATVLAVLRVGKAVQASLSGPLQARCGLSLSEVEALANLAGAPDGALRMSRISDALVTNRPAITRLIDGLEAKGLAERRALPGNRRAVNAAITDAGRARFHEARPYLEDMLSRRLDGVLTDDERKLFSSALDSILLSLGESESDSDCGHDRSAGTAVDSGYPGQG